MFQQFHDALVTELMIFRTVYQCTSTAATQKQWTKVFFNPSLFPPHIRTQLTVKKVTAYNSMQAFISTSMQKMT
jgi:hypothetical protein